MSKDATPHPSLTPRRVAPLCILVAVGIGVVAMGGHRYLTISALAANRVWLCSLVARMGAGAALLYILTYATVVALSLPGGAILTVAGGYLFGTWLGGACAIVGATTGAAAIFLAARAGLGGLAQRAGPLLAKLEAGFAANAFSYLLVLRLVPLFPFWLVNLVPALAGVGLPTFLLATFVGIIPATFVYAGLGSGLGRLVEKPDLDILFHPSVIGPILALAALALLPVWYKRHRAKAAR
jgi:uncharacterized membrane protein YdjX (TVP38/TMEM64 family)